MTRDELLKFHGTLCGEAKDLMSLKNRDYTHFRQMRKPRISENETIDPKGNKIIKSRSVGTGISHNYNQRTLEGSSLTRLASQQVSQPVIKPGTSGVYFTTKDAYTLTDGPTILISNDI